MSRHKANPPLRASIERRIPAPPASVWAQLGLTEAYAGTMPWSDFVVAEDGRSATLIGEIGLGPVRFKRPGTGFVVKACAPAEMVIALELDEGFISVLASFDLAAGGMQTETIMRYAVEAQFAYPVPRLRRFLAGILDTHMHVFVDLVSASATRHWKAETAFGLQPGRRG